ncbi:MAG: enoyl-CoA hydratase-related protein [Gaiellaceae bacterium]
MPGAYASSRVCAMAEVEVSCDGAVQTTRLNRPEKLNAFTRTLHGELQAALEEARDPAVRAVVVTGAGRGF